MGKARDLARVSVDTSGLIASSNLGNAVPADGSISTAKLADGAVTNAKIAAMAASKLTGQVADGNAPSGSVIQVLQATFTGIQSTTGTTWVDITNLSITITPKDANSKFLLLAEINGSADDDGAKFRFTGGNSDNSIGDASGGRQRVHNSWALYSYNAITMMNGFAMYLDSPATTSAITYKCQFGSDDQTTYINRAKTDPDSQYYPRGVSNFVVMEIAA